MPKTPPEPARANRRSNCAKHLCKSSKFELQKNRYLLTAVQFISCLPNFYNMKTQITTTAKVFIGLDIFHFFYSFFKEISNVKHLTKKRELFRYNLIYFFIKPILCPQELKLLQEKLKVKILKKTQKKLFSPKCLCCKTGNLRRIAVFDQCRSPSWYLGGSQNSSSCKS